MEKIKVVSGELINLSSPMQANNGKYYYLFEVRYKPDYKFPCIAFSGAFDYIYENCYEGEEYEFSGSLFEFKGKTYLNVRRIINI